MGEHKIKTTLAQIKSKGTHILERTRTWLNQNKLTLIKTTSVTIGAAALFSAIVWMGNQYLESNTNEVYHVYFDEQEAGLISDPEVVEKFILSKVKQLEEQYPNAHVLLNADNITYEPERAFKIAADDDSVLEVLEDMLTSVALGVEIRIDGELVGVVKDQETADMIFAQLQEKYIPQQKKDSGVVSILSHDEAEEEQFQNSKGASRLEEVAFVEDVNTEIIKTSPDIISDPEEILEKLEIGDTKPTKYVVEKGDCVNCIATRYDISPQVIYDNNNLTEDSILNIGDILDLTVVKPALSVKTVESHVELENIPFDTIVEYDNTMRTGNSTVLTTGVPGKKLVTYLTTKINGHWEDDEIIDEEIVEEPVSQVVRRGTMVVRGEGTGSFSRPVKGKVRITSKFGPRWGRNHNGIDYTSSDKNIYASDNGTVEIAGSHRSYGNYVVIDHKNGYKTLYAHLSKINTTKGRAVEKGEKIGVMGNTGNSTGVHLHFEIQKKGKPVNPANYL